jgi:diaminopimelate decarboxylase
MTQKQAEHFVWEPSGKATIDGYDLAELAKKYPTPFYLISQGQLRDNYRRLRQAFASVEGLETYYSVKSNFESIVLRTLVEEGCGCEISGALDMELAKRAGVNPNKDFSTLHPQTLRGQDQAGGTDRSERP